MASLVPKTGKLGRRLAAHFLRRTTYNAPIGRIKAFAEMTAAEAVAEVLKPIPNPIVPEPIDPEINSGWINTGKTTETGDGKLKEFVCSWWLEEARRDPTINNKMTFWLHTSFTTSWEDDERSFQLFDHLMLFRMYSLGNVKELSYKMTLDQLMLNYLDNERNNKRNPNENYAREYLELFTIGKGPVIGEGNYTNYTEEDIQQAARVLTGFKSYRSSDDPERDERGQYIDPDTGLPMGWARINDHDTDDKTFTAAFGNRTITGAETEEDMWRELNDFVEMVHEQDATAQYYCTKLYRFFVSKHVTEEIKNDIINPLAQTLKNNNYELKPTLEQLLTSQHFFDEDDNNSGDEIIGGLIKSPMDLMLHAVNFFELAIPNPQQDPENHYDDFYRASLQRVAFTSAGFKLFAPPSVAGYPAYYQEPGFGRNWVDANNLVARYSVGEMILTGRRVISGGRLGGVQLDPVDFVRNSGHFDNPEDAEAVVRTFVEYMLCEELAQDRFDYLLYEIFLEGGLTPQNWLNEWVTYVNSGDDSDVKIPLTNLITAIMYAPEYHLF